MSALTLSSFDTLRYVKRLKEADVPEKQAEAQAEALREVLADQSAVQSEASARIATELDTRTERAVLKLEGDIALVRKDLDLVRKDMESLENRLIIKLSVVMAGLIAFAGAVQVVVSKL